MSGLKIVKGAAPAMAIVADRRLWLDTDKTRVVEDGDMAAAFLFAAEGTEISSSDAGRFGLAVEDGRVVLLRAEDPEDPEDPEDVGDGAGEGTGEEAGAEGAGEDADASAGEEAGEGTGDEASADSAAKDTKGSKKDSPRNKKK